MTDVVNVGTTDNDGTGDTLRAAFTQINARLNELLGQLTGGYAWASGVTYTATPVRNWVIESGSAYVCAVNHVSGATFAADFSSGKWLAVDSAQIIVDLASSDGAGMVGFSPAGSITSTTVQAAIEEVSAESANITELQNGAVFLLTGVTGTDTIAGSLTPAITSYVAGQTFRFVAIGDNTGAATINVDGLGAVALTKSGAIALDAGDIKSGTVVTMTYDGTRFQLASGAGSSTQPFAGFRNKIINGGFNINQRVYASGAAVGAGLYGHDRWKMAASGDTYTFATTANVTTITIPASKVLQQVIEGLNLETGTYTLSWSGTAQGKIGAGSYGASGITGAITGGTNTTIEFGPGTVSKVQLEFGSVATVFEQRPYGLEDMLCKRYYENSYDSGVSPGTATTNGAFQLISPGNVIRAWMYVPFKALKRAAPTVSIYSTTGAVGFVRDLTTATDAATNTNSIGASGFNANVTVVISAVTDQLLGHFTASCEL